MQSEREKLGLLGPSILLRVGIGLRYNAKDVLRSAQTERCGAVLGPVSGEFGDLSSPALFNSLRMIRKQFRFRQLSQSPTVFG